MPSPNELETLGIGNSFSAEESTFYYNNFSHTTDCNNNTTSTKLSTGSRNIGNMPVPPSQNMSNVLTSISLQLGSLGNVARRVENISPSLTTQQRHPRLDRTMSEPIVERTMIQIPARSKSFSVSINNAITSSSRYKTELCRPFEENGSCKYGDKCQFAHGIHDVRNLARHPKYKTELCRTFHTSGFCPYGPRCHFVHNDEETGKMRSKSNSLDLSGNVTPDLSSPRQSVSLFSDEIYPSTFQQPASLSPPFDVGTLSESFTFPHHDYQPQTNKIPSLNLISNRARTQSPYSAISALLAQQQSASLRNSDDDVFHSESLDSPVSDDAFSRRIEFLNLALRLQQEQVHIPLFNRR